MLGMEGSWSKKEVDEALLAAFDDASGGTSSGSEFESESEHHVIGSSQK
jgi:hypothetical protein